MSAWKTAGLALLGLCVAMGAAWTGFTTEHRSQSGAARASDNAERPVSGLAADRSGHANDAMALPTGDMDALTAAYENADSLESLAYSLHSRAAGGDENAARVLSKILEECAPLSAVANHADAFEKSAQALPDRQRRIAIAHMARLRRRCAHLMSSTQIDLASIKTADRRWQGGGSPIAIAHRLADSPGTFSPEEARRAVRTVIASRNGEAIFALSDAMGDAGEGRNELLPEYSGGVVDSVAWKLVGCSLGAPCGPSSEFMRSACVSIMGCIPGGFREYAKHYYLTPHQYDLALDKERNILRDIDSGTLTAISHPATERIE